MNKHEYIHLFRGAYRHLHEALHRAKNCHRPNCELIDHIDKAKVTVEVIADDMGIEITNGGK